MLFTYHKGIAGTICNACQFNRTLKSGNRCCIGSSPLSRRGCNFTNNQNTIRGVIKPRSRKNIISTSEITHIACVICHRACGVVGKRKSILRTRCRPRWHRCGEVIETLCSTDFAWCPTTWAQECLYLSFLSCS